MELYKCNDDYKNVDKKSAKLYDIRVLFEDYNNTISCELLLCKVQHSKKPRKIMAAYLSFHDK